MKFSASVKDFAAALKAAGSAMPERDGRDPALSCIMLSVQGGQAWASAAAGSDLAVRVCITGADASEDGWCAVNCKRLLKTLGASKKSGDGMAAVEYHPASSFSPVPAVLAIGGALAKLDAADVSGEYADRLPDILRASVPDGAPVVLDAQVVKSALSVKVLKDMACSDLIAFDPSTGATGVACASDGGHAAIFKHACAGAGGQFEIPRIALSRACAFKAGEFEVIAGTPYGCIRTLDGSAQVIYASPDAGLFPSIRALVGYYDLCDSRAEAEAKDLLRLCRVLEPFIGKGKGATENIMLHIGNGRCVGVRYDTKGGWAPDDSTPSADFCIPCDGDPMRLSLLIRYLRDAADSAADGTVEIRSGKDGYAFSCGQCLHIVAPYQEPSWACERSCILGRDRIAIQDNEAEG